MLTEIYKISNTETKKAIYDITQTMANTEKLRKKMIHNNGILFIVDTFNEFDSYNLLFQLYKLEPVLFINNCGIQYLIKFHRNDNDNAIKTILDKTVEKYKIIER